MRLTGLNASSVQRTLRQVEIDLGFSRPFQRSAKRIALVGGLSDSPMQVLLKQLLTAFALLSPIAHRCGLLAERVVEALRGGQQWVDI